MQVGVVLPSYEIPSDPVTLARFAVTAERLGYAHLAVMDHVLGADLTYRPEWEGRATLVDFHEPFTLFGYVAALTQRIQFVTDVLVLPQRQTVLVAKQAAEIDLLSQGRLRLGVGIGWARPEYQALNEEARTRGPRLEEQVTVLRALFTQETVTFHGQWHHLEAMGLRPLPVQRPIPIWFGGEAEASLHRVAVMGDGWMPIVAPDESAQAAIATIHAHAGALGRDPASIGIEGVIYLEGTTPDDWLRGIEAWQALGATSLTLYTQDAGLASMEAHLDILARFQEITGMPTDISA